MSKALEKIAAENGLKIDSVEYFPAGTTDYSSNIARVRQANSDIWIGIGYPNEAIEMVRQFRAVNYLPRCSSTTAQRRTTSSPPPERTAST